MRLAGLFAPLLGLALLALSCLFLERVPDDEMAITLRRGDLVLVLPLAPRVGDVVPLLDPLDPERRTFRRVLASEAADVAFRGHEALIDGQARRQVEMDRGETHLVLQEEGRALLRLPRMPSRVLFPPQKVPAGHIFLAADARDDAIDSRYWGPLPASSALGVAMLRLGTPNAWQRRITWLRGPI